MNYWAQNDPLFVDGHYVEEWEVLRFDELPTDLRTFIRSEAAQGNKIETISRSMVVLSQPPLVGVLNLPSSIRFVCPIKYEGVLVYDGDQDGVIVHLPSGFRIFPSGKG
jgi:hypothetical protein